MYTYVDNVYIYIDIDLVTKTMEVKERVSGRGPSVGVPV